jgi:hypothetical protein
MMTEVDYTVQLFQPVTPTWQEQFGLLSFFLLFGVTCIIVNGFKAEVLVERVQLPVSYCGVIAVLCLLLPSAWSRSDPQMGLSIFALLLLTLIVMALGKVQTVKHSSIRSDKQLLIPVLATGLILIVCVYLHNDAAAFRGTTNAPVPPLQQFKAQGWLGIISLFLANALWMIVDISTWQRIASVKQEGGEFPLAALRSGTLRVLFESPASWLLGIVLGWSIRALGVLPPGADPSEGLSRFASALAGGTFQLAPPLTVLTPALYPVLIYATVSIMLSTVNALASTISFTAYSDLPPYRDFESVGATDRASLRHARIWTAAFVVIGLILYPLIRHVAGTSPSKINLGSELLPLTPT